MSDRKEMGVGRWIKAIVCFCLLMSVIAIGAYHRARLEYPWGISLSVDDPSVVYRGDSFDVVLRVINKREKKPFEVYYVETTGTFDPALSVSSVSPEPSSAPRVVGRGHHKFPFDIEVPAGETREFTFTLRAEEVGAYNWGFNVKGGHIRPKRTMLLTVVREAE